MQLEPQNKTWKHMHARVACICNYMLVMQHHTKSAVRLQSTPCSSIRIRATVPEIDAYPVLGVTSGCICFLQMPYFSG